MFYDIICLHDAIECDFVRRAVHAYEARLRECARKRDIHTTRSFPLLQLSVRSSPTLGTSVRAYSPRWLLYKSKTEGEKSTRSERSQESGVERVGWRSLSGWVADAQGEVGGKGRRVYVGRSSSGWTAVGENRELSDWEREKVPTKKSPAREGRRSGRAKSERRGRSGSQEPYKELRAYS